MRRLAIVLAVAAALSLEAAPAGSPDLSRLIAAAVADPARAKDHVATDENRKPGETLAFSGVKPGDVVGEFFPGGGYFTRLLSDVVGPTGHVYGLENAGWGEAVRQNRALLADGRLSNVSMDALPFGQVRFPKPLDVAWVTQNYHDLKVPEFGTVDTAAFDRAVFAALKPGGIFFVLDHEAPPGTGSDPVAITKLHRIEKSVVIREVTAAGFRLVAEGTFLRRAADDHSLLISDRRIQGHTDQYALRFEKPLESPSR